MNLQDELFALLSQYPFVHLDRLGRFSILVPLTGAQMISEQFHANSNNPVSLYLFGDNTCQSDIERRTFFNNVITGFGRQCDALIRDLGQLATRFHSRSDDCEVIQKLVKLLQSDKAKALEFQQGNPGLGLMTNDLRAEGQKIISKGEFIVAGEADGARYLQLPNIRTILNSLTNPHDRLLDSDRVDNYLANLALIAKPQSENQLIPAVSLIVRQANIRARLATSAESVFSDVYKQLQRSYSYLKELDEHSLSVYAEQFGLVTCGEKDFTDWTGAELIDAIAGVFKGAYVIDETHDISMDRFANIYNHALVELAKTDNNQTKTNTYKLFILQSFLYLCAQQIRLKNPDRASAFLENINSSAAMSQIIIDLCSNESALITRLNNEYGITAKDYAVLLSACHTIAIAHLDIPHYDELRTACMPLNIDNTQYLVIGGRLCWSTSPISDYGNINSVSMQKVNFAARFKALFSGIQSKEVLSLLDEALNAADPGFEEIALASLEANFELFSEEQLSELLNTALAQVKYRCAEFLLFMGVDDEQLFQRYFNQQFNKAAVECFLSANPDYARYITKDDLIEAQKNGEEDKVCLILEYKPELSDTDRLRYPHDLMLKPRFDDLLKHWQNKANTFSQLNHHGASLAATQLFQQLTAAGNRFFSCRLSQKSIDEFEKKCMLAFDEAKPIMDTHRGWHGFPLFFRAVLGFIAAITVIPAVIVALATPKGYAGTFFKRPETDSAQHLAETLTNVNELCRLSEDLNNQNCA